MATYDYEQRQWQVIEKPFRRADQPHTETIFTIGNGLVGVRGTFEEGYPNDHSTTLAAGVFNHAPGELVPELVSIPNWLALTVTVNGQAVRLDQGKIYGFERVLDLKTATLRRGVLWYAPDGTLVRLLFERFASLANPHVLALRVSVLLLSEGEASVTVESALDGTVNNPGNPAHWATLAGSTDGDTLTIGGTTGQSGYTIGMAARLLVEGAPAAFEDATADPKRPAHRTAYTAREGETVTFTKLVALHTTRDSADPAAAAAQTLNEAILSGYSALHAAHTAAWAGYWDAMDVVIEGDEVAQRAVRFSLYHVLIAAPTHEERVSIAAKTLSGFGYRGHVFWDTELFIVPPFTVQQPELARKLLMYRYHNLPGARAKARDNGYEGAMFPWESTDTGEETTPREVITPTGEKIRIWTGDNEQHISTDITYAVLQYWRWTGDDDWFARYGAEIVLDTAVFWGSRAEYDEAEGRYELRMQIGPDEYHENVDNSVFTNRVVRWHLRQARAVVAWLKDERPEDAVRLTAALDITGERLDKWKDIADRMWIPISDEGGGVFEQFENFFERLKPIDLSDYDPRVMNMDFILGHERTQRKRVIKQADVVMLMALLFDELEAEYGRAFLQRNYALYSAVCDHGSSLSPAMHAWVAARLGLPQEAYELFMFSATIDLDDNKGNVKDGIHAAACGGTWQAVVFGFCGLKLHDNGFTVQPALPAHWRRVQFKLMHNGQPHTVTVTQEVE